MPRVILGSDKEGFGLKSIIKEVLIDNNIAVTDVTEAPANDFIESISLIVRELNQDKDAIAINIDAYGVGSFIAACKHKGIVAAEVSDERSAYMTRSHNNTRILCVGDKIVGKELAINIALGFVNGTYEGGRHQIRIDMLNKI